MMMTVKELANKPKLLFIGVKNLWDKSAGYNIAGFWSGEVQDDDGDIRHGSTPNIADALVVEDVWQIPETYTPVAFTEERLVFLYNETEYGDDYKQIKDLFK